MVRSRQGRRNITGIIVTVAAAVVLGLMPVGSVSAQSNGYTLDEAVAAARERTGGKVLRARTKSSGGRKVHEIRVLTKDSHVKTLRFNGKRGNGKGN